MISLDPGPQRDVSISINFSKVELDRLHAAATSLRVKPVYLVLYAADLLCDAIADNESVVDIVVSESLKIKALKAAGLVSFNSQIAVPGCWEDPARAIRVSRGVPAAHTLRFATVTLLDAMPDPGVAQAAKTFCDNYAAFSHAKVKSRHFMLNKFGKKQTAPAHRGFVVYDPSKFRAT